MPSRNRRRAPTRGKRTGRNVWVNTNVNSVFGINTTITVDLLLPADSFMEFDSTVQSIVIPGLTWSLSTNGVANYNCAVAFIAAPRAMDPDDFVSPLSDNIGPPWMGLLWASNRFSGIQAETLQLVDIGGMRFKSKRRFRENNTTIWMVAQNVGDAGSDEGTLDGLVRILLHIP